MNLKAKLFSPSRRISDRKEQKRAELLSVLLLLNLAGPLVIMAYLTLMRPEIQSLHPLPIVFVLSVVAYGISRTRFYKVAAYMALLLTCIGVTQTTIDKPDLVTLATAPMWLGVGILVSNLVLSFRHTVLMALVIFASYGVVLYFAAPPLRVFVMSQLICTAVSSALILIGTYLRDESDRLLELEKAKVIHSSKLASLGEMAGGLAHEINTPLAILRLKAEELLELQESQTLSPELLKKSLNELDQTISRITKIVIGLRKFSRDGSQDEFSPVNVSNLIKSTFDLCEERCRSNGVRLEVESDGRDAWFSGREVEISQVLLNLINNAFDAVSGQPDKWIRVFVREGPENLEIRVMDSGAGLSETIQKKLFQPFFTTKEIGKGTGLGLSISKGIVQSHQGDLTLDTASSHTCFVVTLPKILAFAE